MIDLSHTSQTTGLSVFLPQGVDANSWQAWQKPRGFVMATIYAIGPGGGGGSGRSQGTSVMKYGGGGGGSGALSRITIPLFLLPDTLFIRVHPGGSGGAGVIGFAGVDGIAGNVAFSPLPTVVSFYPEDNASIWLLRANAGAGGAGGTSGATTGGAGGTASTSASAAMSTLGSTLFIAGNAGGSDNIIQGTGPQIYGGAAGAPLSTSTFNGYYWAPSFNAAFQTSPGGTVAVSPPTAGGNGFSSNLFPLLHCGGTGGTAISTASTAGGNGSVPGAGGGGGGPSAGSNTSGRGGDGGPGCVIIQCW